MRRQQRRLGEHSSDPGHQDQHVRPDRSHEERINPQQPRLGRHCGHRGEDRRSRQLRNLFRSSPPHPDAVQSRKRSVQGILLRRRPDQTGKVCEIRQPSEVIRSGRHVRQEPEPRRIMVQVIQVEILEHIPRNHAKPLCRTQSIPHKVQERLKETLVQVEFYDGSNWLLHDLGEVQGSCK